MTRRRGRLQGRVQGVGLRPALARLAGELGLVGWVLNEGAGVRLEVEGPPEAVDAFVRRCGEGSAATFSSVEWSEVPPEGGLAFEVRPSEAGPRRAGVPPDLAPCPECRSDLRSGPRAGHPFTSCTACGPRWSVLQSLPWDRERSTMARFPMCPRCAAECANPRDRRFHAQTNACPDCGPRLWASPACADPLTQARALLRKGGILAVKGVGAWQLLCDARDEAAVARLRARKGRPAKPFAVMVPDLQAARALATLSEVEAAALASPAAPILVARGSGGLAPSVAPGLRRVGLALPSSPLHLLLVDRPLVCTSGNREGEPACVTDADALERLADVADGWLGHDRSIARRLDDAVVQEIDDGITTIRLGRGLAPLPLPKVAGAPRVALGAHLKAAPALAADGEAVLWPHVGDLEGLGARRALAEAVADIEAVMGVKARFLVHDAHPDCGAAAVARSLGLPTVLVWHHHAHVAAVMAEHGLERALGFAWDGFGVGPDAAGRPTAAWGGETLVVEGASWRRVASLRRFPLLGGAGRDGGRALAGLRAAGGLPTSHPAALLAAARPTSSVGRLFDALAADLGLAERSRYEGEAAMRLEDLAMAHGPVPGRSLLRGDTLDWTPLLAPGAPAERAARLHADLAASIVEIALAQGIPDVVLSGGCFHNRVLAEAAATGLRAAGLRPWLGRSVPMGDGGLAVGQLRATEGIPPPLPVDRICSPHVPGGARKA